MTLAEQLRAALGTTHDVAPDLLEGDHRTGIPQPDLPMPAAVLVAITDRERPGMILTQRTDTLTRHAGQIAFPGGRIDPGDDGAIGAALREAEEEIALDRTAVDLVGTADRYRTVTGFDVIPVVGVVPPDLPLVASPHEVSAIFEVPFAYLMNRDNHREGRVDWQGHERRFHEILWQDRRIWGATAAMIVNLSRRLRWAA